MKRRSLLTAPLLAPAATIACADSRTPGRVDRADALYIDLPDAPRVTVRLWGFVPEYPGYNGGRIDMCTSRDGVAHDGHAGCYSWAFTEIYDDHRVVYSASNADHAMSDRVRLCTATHKDGGATFDLTFTDPHSNHPTMWNWTGTTQYLDGRVCGYQGHAVRQAAEPVRSILLVPDVGTFSMEYEVTYE